MGMGNKNSQHQMRWQFNLGLLQIAAIVAPVGFLLLVDILRHTVFSEQMPTLGGFAVYYGLVTLGVVLFSLTVFRIIGRLEQRIIHQNQQLAALNEIAQASTAKLRLEDLLSASLDHILPQVLADYGLICLVDREKEEHTAVCYRGFPKEVVAQIQHAKLQADPIGREVVRMKRQVLFEQIFQDPDVAEAAGHRGIKGGISTPLMSEGEVNGILAIATREPRQFSDADQEFLRGIGGQLGMAIQNATLYEQSQQQNRELSALLAMGKVVTSSFNLDEALSASLETVMEVVAADAAEAWLVEEDEELVLRCHKGQQGEAFLERPRFRTGEGIIGLVAQEKKPILVQDLPSDARFLRQGVVQAGYHTFYALPLRYQGKLVGILAVAALSPHVFEGPRDQRLLEGIGEWLAIAIENAQLYHHVQDLAVLQERERIAREMHDGMAQLLGYMNTQTIAVRKFLSNQQLAEARDELTNMENITRDLYADVREGILGLRTAAGGRGLLSALREYTERYIQMSGIQVEIKADMDSEKVRLVPSAEVQLLRIIQEALTNVRKHAKAGQVTLQVVEDDHALDVLVVDNGQGFAPSRLPSTGWPRFGLQTMRERAEAVGGTLTIASAPGEGTTVHVRVPVLPNES